jgi:hypothetical protein
VAWGWLGLLKTEIYRSRPQNGLSQAWRSRRSARPELEVLPSAVRAACRLLGSRDKIAFPWSAPAFETALIVRL